MVKVLGLSVGQLVAVDNRVQGGAMGYDLGRSKLKQDFGIAQDYGKGD